MESILCFVSGHTVSYQTLHHRKGKKSTTLFNFSTFLSIHNCTSPQKPRSRLLILAKPRGTRSCVKGDVDYPTETPSSTPPANSDGDAPTGSGTDEGLVFDLGHSCSWDSGDVGSPVVRRYLSDDEERWYMWYHGSLGGDTSPESIGLAVSSNGVHWERRNVGVMHCNKDWWAFDTQSIRPSDVLMMSSSKIRISGGVYWLYYTGFSSENVKFPDDLKLREKSYKSLPGLAISQDGKYWARIEGDHHSGALFDVGNDTEWDSLYIGSPQVVCHSSDDMRMYYHSFDLSTRTFSVGIARSRDGLRWVKLGKIIAGGPPGSFDELGITNRHVVRSSAKGGYVMVYEGIAADGRRSIGAAESADGLKDWRRREEPVLQPATAGSGWDDEGVGQPCLVQMDKADEWRLYYSGAGRCGRKGIGMAVSDGNGGLIFRRWRGFHL